MGRFQVPSTGFTLGGGRGGGVVRSSGGQTSRQRRPTFMMVKIESRASFLEGFKQAKSASLAKAVSLRVLLKEFWAGGFSWLWPMRRRIGEIVPGSAGLLFLTEKPQHFAVLRQRGW